MAFVFGAVLASTDPVTVSALGRRLSLPSKIQALVQAASLFNDATSLVLFQIAVSFAVGGSVAAGWGSVLWHGVAQFVALVTPYAAYVAGERLDVSGVTAVIVAGLLGGARRTRITTPPGCRSTRSTRPSSSFWKPSCSA